MRTEKFETRLYLNSNFEYYDIESKKIFWNIYIYMNMQYTCRFLPWNYIIGEILWTRVGCQNIQVPITESDDEVTLRKIRQQNRNF